MNGIVNLKPTATQPPRVVEVVTPVANKPIIIDNQKQPVSTLRNYVEGKPIKVDWYQKQRDKVSGSYTQDAQVSATIDQFIKINKLLVRLDGDIDYSQDSKDLTFNIKGTLFVTTGLVPGEGDLFVYEAGNGRNLTYTITQASRLSALNESVYRCEFTALYYTSDKRFNDLNSKVLQEFIYIEDYANFGKASVITTDLFRQIKNLILAKDRMCDDYIKEFRDKETHLLLVPSQMSSTYDPFTAKAMQECLTHFAYHEMSKVRFQSIASDALQGFPTVWDALTERRPELLVGARIKSACINVSFLPSVTMLRTIRYCGASYLVFPQVESSTAPVELDAGDWIPTEGNSPLGPTHLLLNTSTLGAPVITHDVCKDGMYIFSRAFYNRDHAGMSFLELLLWRYLENQPPDVGALTQLVNNWRAWSNVKRYFYTPALLLLIDDAVRNNNSITNVQGNNR